MNLIELIINTKEYREELARVARQRGLPTGHLMHGPAGEVCIAELADKAAAFARARASGTPNPEEEKWILTRIKIAEELDDTEQIHWLRDRIKRRVAWEQQADSASTRTTPPANPFTSEPRSEARPESKQAERP